MSKPVDSISIPTASGSLINAAIWENEVQQSDQTYTAYSVTIEKRYRDGKEWKTAKSFNANELLQVAYAAEEAYKRSLQRRESAGRKVA